MGMNAEIIAVGRFCHEVVEYMDHSAETYAKTRPGAIVTRLFFEICQGSTMSRRLASCLGIDDPRDFNQHAIDPSRVDMRSWPHSCRATRPWRMI